MTIAALLADKEFLNASMQTAIEVAEESIPHDIPIGALVVDVATRQIIGASGNTREEKHDPTLHAEISAVRAACEHREDWRLDDCIIFTTLEPCVMCAGALVSARIGAIVFGATDPQYGAAGSIYNFFSDPRLNHNAPVIGGVRASECGKLVNDFFATRR